MLTNETIQEIGVSNTIYSTIYSNNSNTFTFSLQPLDFQNRRFL